MDNLNGHPEFRWMCIASYQQKYKSWVTTGPECRIPFEKEGWVTEHWVD